MHECKLSATLPHSAQKAASTHTSSRRLYFIPELHPCTLSLYFISVLHLCTLPRPRPWLGGAPGWQTEGRSGRVRVRQRGTTAPRWRAGEVLSEARVWARVCGGVWGRGEGHYRSTLARRWGADACVCVCVCVRGRGRGEGWDRQTQQQGRFFAWGGGLRVDMRIGGGSEGGYAHRGGV